MQLIPPRRGPGHPEQGFTLIEILSVLMIMAILSVMAAPVVADMTARHRIDMVRTELMQSLQSARWEAVARGSTVTLSRITGCGTPLTSDADWSCGWIVFVDTDGDRIERVGDVRLQVVDVPAGVRVSKPTEPRDAQQFNAFGQSVRLGQRYEIVPTDPALATLAGSICYSTGTRLRYKPGTGTC